MGDNASAVRTACSALRRRVTADAVERNNRRIRATPHPIRSPDTAFARHLRASYPTIAGEWQAAERLGRRFPRIDQVISEDQGSIGAWRIGLLGARGARVDRLANQFPETVAAITRFPEIRSAMFSIFEPGTRLDTHRGYDRGVLRYHLGIDCGSSSFLEVGGDRIPYEDGHDVLFDDTEPHRAANEGPTRRVTLFCEVQRPLSGWSAVLNGLAQFLITQDPRYRHAGRAATEWDLALNPDPPPPRAASTRRQG